jgi:hypothetical protein
MALRCGIREVVLLTGIFAGGFAGGGNCEAAAKLEGTGIATERDAATVEVVRQVAPEFDENAVVYLRLQLLVLAIDRNEPFTMKIWLIDEDRHNEASMELLNEGYVGRISLYPMASVGEERSVEIALPRREISSNAKAVRVSLEPTIEDRILSRSAVEITAATLSDFSSRAN